MVDTTTQAQLRLIFRVIDVLAAVDVPVWLFGGWGLDARIGRITRPHGDVEFWVPRTDGPRSRAALVAAGSTALATQPPAEACEFVWDDVSFSTAYFDRRADGTFAQLQGRWSDWSFPADSFGADPGLLDGTEVPAMSVAGMLAMKEQFPTLRKGRPWREKDIGDMAVLRRLLAARPKGVGGMNDPGLSDLRARAAQGDTDAVDQLVELAGERGDLAELRRLAEAGSRDAADELVQRAAERGDTEELRRLAEAGNRDAADVLAELGDEDDDQAAPESRGVTVQMLATVDLAGEIEGMAGRQLRMRMVTIEPGGVFGPVHDHKGRPGTVYVLQGTITDHRDGVATDYGPGVGWPEDRNTMHWLENRGTVPAVEISVDIVRQE